MHGYNGNKVLAIKAGESHVGLLLEQESESDGGKLFTHGIANGGRLGIGPARKVKKSLLGRLRVKGRTSSEVAEENAEPDFSALVAEPDPDDYQKEDTRYQPVPSQVWHTRSSHIASSHHPPCPLPAVMSSHLSMKKTTGNESHAPVHC